MSMRYEHETGGSRYWIRYRDSGVHEVRCDEYPYCDDQGRFIKTVFTGRYEKCVAYIDSILRQNAEADMYPHI